LEWDVFIDDHHPEYMSLAAYWANRNSCHQAHRLHAAEHACQSLDCVPLDECVAELVLSALTPASVEATLAALEESERSCTAERVQPESAA
jgi:hypothetical protein